MCKRLQSENENNSMNNLFVSKPVAIGYKFLKNPNYDNLKMKNEGYNKSPNEICVEWFVDEMLEVETYMKKVSTKKDIETNPETKTKNYD